MPTLRRQFGEMVRGYRTGAALSQQQLAEKAGISEVWLRKIEQGTASPSFDTIESLAKALHAHPAELFGGTPASDQKGTSAFALLVRKISGRSPADLKRIVGLVDFLDK